MKDKKTITILALALVVLIAGAAILYNALGDNVSRNNLAQVSGGTSEGENGSDSDTEVQANPAPDFTVYDYYASPVNLSDMKGKPTIVNFWASWCGPCKSEMPDFEEAYLKYGDKINFMMVNLTDGVSETVDSATSYVDSQGYTFPVYYDTLSDAAYTYGVYAVPMTCFIDAEGNFIVYATGAIDAATLQRGIDMIYIEE